MSSVKPARLYLYITVILALINGCTGTAAPTVTQTIEPATAAATRPLANSRDGSRAGFSRSRRRSLSPFGNGGYDVQHYTLDLTVNDVATADLSGQTVIEARATQTLSSLNFDFIGFEIQEITVNGQPAEFERNKQELIVTPASPLAENESFTVEVRYQGSPGEMDSIAIPIQTGWITFDGGSFVLSEPDGAASFYPVNDHPSG